MRSTVGKGSVFGLSVPLGPDETAAPPEDGALDPAPRALDILLVEDDPLAGDALRSLLLTEGHRVSWAADMSGALAAALNADQPPEALIVDYNLGAVTGPEVVERLRQRLGRPLPALILTGDVRERSRRDVAAAGLPFLPKPLPHDELLAWIEQVRARVRRAAPPALVPEAEPR